MKLLNFYAFVLSIVFSTAINAAEHQFQKAICKMSEDSDRELVIEPSPHELAFPTYNVKLYYRGTLVLDLEDMPVKQNDDSRLIVETSSEIEGRGNGNYVITAGLYWEGNRAKEGFYVKAANGGESPLPALVFDTCKVLTCN